MGTALIASSFVIAPIAQAASLTPSQVNAITSLLQAFGVDSTTIANVQGILNGAPVSNSSASSTPPVVVNGPGDATSCMSLSGTLSFGSEGEDVTRLQQFLASSTSYYPQGLVTGYYGHLTEDAVQRWQAAHNIVTNGTPDTTGYGLIGPRTRGEIEREMETECNSGDSHSGQSSHEGEGSASSTASSTDSNSGSSDN